MQVKLRAIAPEGTTSGTALSVCAELLSRALPDGGGLTIDLLLLPSPGPKEDWEQELERKHLAKRARLPKLSWSEKTKRLGVQLPSALDASAFAVLSDAGATLPLVVADLRRGVGALATELRARRDWPGEALIDAVERLLDDVPDDEDEIGRLAVAGGEERRARKKSSAPPRDKPIIDIRYRTDEPALASAFQWSWWVGDRICRKLRELGFSLGGRADHLAIQLVGDGSGVSVTPALGGDGFVGARVGVDANAVAERDREGREDLLADATCAALEALRPDGVASIRRVRAELAAARRALAVVYFEKDTRDYGVRVLHQLCPYGEGPLGPIRPRRTYYATLEYRDHRTGFVGWARLFEFDGYEEIHGAIGSVTVDGDVIRVRPKRGDHYDVPLEIALSELTAGALAPPA